MTSSTLRAVALIAAAGVLSGCVYVAAGTAGALILDEGFIENDGKFDPLEDTALGRQIY